MLTILFFAALLWVVWKMFLLGIKATWGIAKFACMILLLPAFLIGLVCVGLIYLAIPVLLIAGVAAVIRGISKA